MVKYKNGFTLIEVALFLAVTGLLFVSIAVGTQSTITQQRFTDATQNFAEFLRSIYSEVSNPQSVSTGRSETLAIYGKLVVFGESQGLDDEPLDQGINADGSQKVYVYDVIGDVNDNRTGTITEILADLDANVVTLTREDGTNIWRATPAGIVEGYTVRWAATIEQARDADDKISHQPYTGSILVVRHPRSGTINTLVSPKVIEVNKSVATMNELDIILTEDIPDWIRSLLTDKLDSFTTSTIDFCLNPSGIIAQSEFRRDIRLVANARNASGVEIIDTDSSDNKCRNL